MSVMVQVVLESLILTAVAGYGGLVVGVGVLELVNMFIAGTDTGMFRDPGVDLATLGRALVILVGSGILAGLIPARRAVKVRPVEALRAI